MIFEFDPAKSALNGDKHGVDFESAQRLWDDPDVLHVRARFADEARVLAIGRLDGRVWTAVITYRGSRVRIISVRRARSEEVRFYESR